MGVLNEDSLAVTLDALNEAFFYGRPLPGPERVAVAEWIASRQGLPDSYRGLYAPTELDYQRGVKVFTGDVTVTSGAGSAHILGEEAGRALAMLGVSTPAVCEAMYRGQASLGKILDLTVEEGHRGHFCCGKCSVALWRNLAAGGHKDAERHLENGMKRLKEARAGNGQWRPYPTYYTLLALTEISLPSAVEEMQYAAPLCERLLKRKPGPEKYAQRRLLLAERVLERC